MRITTKNGCAKTGAKVGLIDAFRRDFILFRILDRVRNPRRAERQVDAALERMRGKIEGGAMTKPIPNRSLFFNTVRPMFPGGRLTVDQVAGMERVIDTFFRHGHTDRRWLAYVLATQYHETSATMQPIKEYGGSAYFRRMYDIEGDRPAVALRLGNTVPGDGVRYCGRGDVMITGRRNYDQFGALLGIDLLGNPDLAMDPAVSARIIIEGMVKGLFTGHGLERYFDEETTDPIGARRIVNGKDRAWLIAGYYDVFHSAIKNAGG